MILGSQTPTSFVKSKPTFPVASCPFTDNHQYLSSTWAKPWALPQNLFFLLISFIHLLYYFLILFYIFKKLLIFRARGRGLEKETSICCSAHPRIPWLTPVCAPTRDWTWTLDISGWCSNWLGFLARTVLLSYCCCSKLPQNWQFKTTQIYYPSGQKSGMGPPELKSRCCRAAFPWRLLGENPFACISSF